jgi:hypothetical protein
MKLDLLTKATVVDDTIRFVSSNKSKDKEKSLANSSENDDNEESNEPNYDEDKDQLERGKTRRENWRNNNKPSLLKKFAWL